MKRSEGEKQRTEVKLLVKRKLMDHESDRRWM